MFLDSSTMRWRRITLVGIPFILRILLVYGKIQEETCHTYHHHVSYRQVKKRRLFQEISEGLTTGRNVITGETVTLSDNTIVEPEQALVVEFKRK